MKRALGFAILAVALAAVGSAQTSMTPGMQNAPARKSPLAEYAGSWAGTFQGHTWLAIRLTLQGNQIAGTVQHPHDLKFNDDGQIKSISDERLTGVVENAVLNGDGLLLTVKDPNSQQTSRYEMRLTTANTAQVKMVEMSMPPGMPKVKPWMLSRVEPNAVTQVR